jgi:ADP-glucose pyrophosphorylase
MRSNPRVLGIVLAGGEGKRLWPLTADRAKPAVPFGGSYRLIDFVLSNLVNAGYVRIAVLTQYKSHSLDRHITKTWRMSTLLGNYVTPVPAQQRLGPRWFTGSADAIFQSFNLIYDDQPDHIVVFGADHVYRMVDFALSNLVNGGYLKIVVLTQYKSHSLDRHITQTWRMSTVVGDYITPVPAQQRLGPRWYTGSADAILQSSNLIYDDKPDYIVVFGADHVYRMDPRQMVAQHIESGAGATVAGIRVPRLEASAFGVIDAASDHKVNEFLEKPADPPALPDSADEAYE